MLSNTEKQTILAAAAATAICVIITCTRRAHAPQEPHASLEHKHTTQDTSADHTACSVDASAKSTCTCEEDCLNGCDICEKELHKKKIQRIEAGTASAIAIMTASTEKAGVTSPAVATSSSALAQRAVEKDGARSLYEALQSPA